MLNERSCGWIRFLPILVFNQLENETFGKCQFLFKFKKGDNFIHRNTWSISRINPPEAESPTKKLGKKGRFIMVSK